MLFSKDENSRKLAIGIIKDSDTPEAHEIWMMLNTRYPIWSKQLKTNTTMGKVFVLKICQTGKPHYIAAFGEIE